MDDGQSRLRLQEQILRARMSGHQSGDLPRPPYHVRGVAMLYLQCRFDPAELGAIVPPELRPAKSGWGTIVAYTVAQGWGIAPFTGFFLSAEVEGRDGPDGQPAFYMHSGLFSGVGGKVMSATYNANLREGWSRERRDGDTIAFETGIADSALVRMEARLTGEPVIPLTGFSNYIGRRAHGGFNSYTVAWSGEFHPVSVDKIEFLSGAEQVLRVVRPLEYVWTVYIADLPMAFSSPIPLDAADRTHAQASQNAGILSLFSRLGRAAAILDPDSRIRTLNAAAEGLVLNRSLSVIDGRLRPSRSADSAAYDRMISTVGKGGIAAVTERVALAGADGHAVLAQGLAVDEGIAGVEGVLVFFDDPVRDVASDPGPGLELLGLTPAEARVAGLVGRGRSPREAADELQLSLNTVRSALKISFDKLGINRQSELAKIVVRLEA